MPMREARYRFSDDVRAVTRAIALRMIHAGTVATSPEALAAWIARTDDLREKLTKDGYGSAFTAGDLFPLFQGYVSRKTAAATPERSGAGRARWVWIGAIVAVAIVIAVIVASM